MKLKILMVALLAFAVTACHNHEHEHEHDNEHEHEVEQSEEHDHEHEQTENQTNEEHEHVKVQYTAYTNSFELFAEADVFVVGEKANILSHFSKLPSFEALKVGKMTVILTINGKEVKQTLTKPTRKGIYSFDIKPLVAGTGTLRFEVDNKQITVSDVVVYANHNQAHEHAHHEEPSMVNKVVFTKEQAWKIDFRTELAQQQPFGQIIKTVAKVEPATGNEKVVAAKTGGIVLFSNNNLLEGNTVRKGQNLFKISSGGMSDDNISVQIAEAKNNFENAEANFNRKNELAQDKIISENELQNAEKQYENAKAVYQNLISNFSTSGQSIKSPISGFLKQVFVANGQYVEAGQPLFTVSQNQALVLNAFVQQQYSGILSTIYSANVKTLYDNKSYTFEELNGKVLSYGKSVGKGSFLLPVNLQIDNKAGFVQGSLVEVYLKTLTNSQAVTVPTTALLEEQGNYFVYVQVTPELFEKREVKTSVSDGINTEIASGLKAGERVISKGAMLVKLAQASGALDPHSGHVH